MPDGIPDIETICTHADDRESRFERVIRSTEPDLKMMWYSELFIFAQLCEMLDCSTIVESGRARGFSTEVLAEYSEGTNMNIISIEVREGTENADVAERKLSEYDSVDLRYGDSRTILPEIVDESTGVLIDGPKGDDALKFALDLLDTESVPCVGVHDLHKEVFYRDLSEILFNHRLYTDSGYLVDRFQQYDESYFEWKNKNTPADIEVGPYKKNGVESASYGPTLGIFFNGVEPFDERVRQNYFEYLDNIVLSSIGTELEKKRTFGGPVSRRLYGLILRLGRTVLK